MIFQGDTIKHIKSQLKKQLMKDKFMTEDNELTNDCFEDSVNIYDNINCDAEDWMKFYIHG